MKEIRKPRLMFEKRTDTKKSSRQRPGQKRQPRAEWIRLDNASKIFPPNHNSIDTKVFRLTCELAEVVDPEILQQAADQTYRAYPLLQYVLRRGVFWYYLEKYNLEPVVLEESQGVCAPIYKEEQRDLLFRINYYGRRINMEIFHVLTDGTGAFHLFQDLLYRYLILAHPAENGKRIEPPTDGASLNQLMQDSFRSYYGGKVGELPQAEQKLKEEGHKRSLQLDPPKEPEKLPRHAVQLKGRYNPDYQLKLIEGKVSVKAVLDLAHEEGVSLSVYLGALLMQSLDAQVPVRKKGSIVIQVPVNLRQYFPSRSARNFFSTINVGYDFSQKQLGMKGLTDTLEQQFRHELTADNMQKRLNRLMWIETFPLARIVPTLIKDPVLKIAHRISDLRVTSTFSNLGRISFPKELSHHIKGFSVTTSARRLQVTCCTWGDDLVLSFSTPYQETEAVRAFFTALTGRGIDVVITSNTDLQSDELMPGSRNVAPDKRGERV